MPYIGYDEEGQLHKVPDGDPVPEVPISVPDDAQVQGGTVEYRYDGANNELTTNIPPEPSEAKKRTLAKFEEWDGNKDRARQLKRDYLWLEYVNEGNYTEAKNEQDVMEQDGLINSTENQTIKDILDGVQ